MKPRLVAACAIAAVAILAAAPDAGAKRAPAGFLGISPSTVPTASEFQRMARGGVSITRMQISWPAIQPVANGPYDWSQIDQQVAGAAASGINLLPFHFGTPTWAANCAGVGPELCDRVLPTRSAAGEDGFRKLLAAAVARYGTGGSFWTDSSDAFNPPYRPITTWQIGNEPNAAEFSPPKPSVAGYHRLLQISNEVIRAMEPGATIVLAGMFRPVRKFLSKLYAKPGAKALFDAVALQPYSADLEQLDDQLKAARQVMLARGDGATPMWISEIGWGSAKAPSVRVPLAGLLRGIKGQARLLRSALNYFISQRGRYRISHVLWFTWRDVPAKIAGRCFLCRSTGLFTASGAPKPSWTAYTRIAGGTP